MANPVPNKSDGNANRTPVKWTAYSASGAIEIDDEVLGGLSEREILYDTINDSLFVKKSWEFQYRKIL